MKKKTTKKATKKPVQKAAPVSAYPMEWLGLAPESVDVDTLKSYFQTIPELDVECWRELGVVEITFPNKRYIDLEIAKPEDMDDVLTALMAERKAEKLFFVSVEPVCMEEEKEFLAAAAKALNMSFVGDNESFEPVVG